jgi:hypothetical protein
LEGWWLEPAAGCFTSTGLAELEELAAFTEEDAVE